MKNVRMLSLLLICSFFAYTITAQVSFGLRGGVNFANVNATDAIEALAPDFKYTTAFSVAGMAEIPITENFAFQPELAYTVKGFSLEESVNVELFNTPIPLGVRAITKFGYLEAPLLGKVKFGNETVKAYIAAGPSFGYALNGNLQTRTNSIIDIKLIDTDINLDAIDYERFEVSGVAGAGLQFQTVFGQFFVDARYQHGFTELYDIPLVEEKIKNQGFSLNAGFFIPLH